MGQRARSSKCHPSRIDGKRRRGTQGTQCEHGKHGMASRFELTGDLPQRIVLLDGALVGELVGEQLRLGGRPAPRRRRRRRAVRWRWRRRRGGGRGCARAAGGRRGGVGGVGRGAQHGLLLLEDGRERRHQLGRRPPRRARARLVATRRAVGECGRRARLRRRVDGAEQRDERRLHGVLLGLGGGGRWRCLRGLRVASE